MITLFCLWVLSWFLALAYLVIRSQKIRVNVFNWLPQVANRQSSGFERVIQLTFLLAGLSLMTFGLWKEIAGNETSDEKTALLFVAGERFQEKSPHFLQQQSLLKGIVTNIQRQGLDFELGFLFGNQEDFIFCAPTRDTAYLDFYLEKPASFQKIQSSSEVLLNSICDAYASSEAGLHICYLFNSLKVARQQLEKNPGHWERRGVKKTLLILDKSNQEVPTGSFSETEIVFLDGKIPPAEDTIRFLKIPKGEGKEKWVSPMRLDQSFFTWGLVLIFLSGWRFGDFKIRFRPSISNNNPAVRISLLLVLFGMGANSPAEYEKANGSTSGFVASDGFSSNLNMDLSKGIYHERLAMEGADSSKAFHLANAANYYRIAANQEGESGLQGLLGLVRVFGAEQKVFSAGVFLELDERLRERYSKATDLKQRNSLQKSLAYLWLARDLKAWIATDSMGGGGESKEQGAESQRMQMSKSDNKKPKGKSTQGKGQEDSGTSTNFVPGKGNLDLAKWNGEVKDLDPSQSRDFIEAAARKILSGKR